jgi:opacity protein-like surface antigen
MKRLSCAFAVLALITLPNAASAAGLYFEGQLGLNLSDTIDFDRESFSNDLTIEPNAGVLGSLALGNTIPLADIDIRIEGELAFRTNGVDDVDDNLGTTVDIENADITSYAGMANVYLDFYVMPDFALTLGGGLGYANVDVDAVVVSDSASALAYQGRVGARYNFTPNWTLGLAYTYFATTELEIDTEGVLGLTADEAKFDYTNHAIGLGVAYYF